MGLNGTFLKILQRACVVCLAGTMLLGCLIDDPAPCTIHDDVSPDPKCVAEELPEFLFKLEYTTADGNMPAGRLPYVESGGLNISQSETECKHALQYIFNTNQNYLDAELGEIIFYRGNICGQGYRLKSNLGDIRVKRTRMTGVNTYDYDLELYCTDR